jgi:hypothetical protein
MLLPSTVGSTTHPNLLVGSGKKGTIYLIDTNNMGHFHAASDQIVQELTGNPIEGAFDTPAYFNGHIYYAAEGDTLKEFAISQAHITATPTSQSGDDFLFPGSTPSISANGTMSGIVWTVDHGLGQLRAYQASNVANELYTSDDAAGNRDDLGTPIKFSVATVANSHVYVGTDGALVGYGLFPSISATVSGTTLTLTKVIPGSATFTIQHAASFQGLTVTGSNNTAINGNQTSFTPTGPINSIVVNLGASADTLTIDGNSNGAITLPGGMSIAGTNGIKTITITNTRLIAGKLNVSFTGNGAETIHLTDVNVGGAVGISHLGTGNTSVTIDTNNNALNRFGSLTINNGIGADTNIVEDTNFTGGVAINNGKGAAGNTGQFGGSQNKLLTVNDPNLATIGGSLAITTLSGQSDSEVSDYNILGNATITSGAGIAGQSQGNVIGLQHRRTSGSSGTPIINGNVAIGGSAVNGAPLTINIGTGAVAGDNSLVIGGNLTVNAGGVGSANITLNDLFAATGITSMTLGAMTSGNLVQVQGTSATAVFNGFNLTSNATGSNTFNIQDQAGKIDFAGGVKFQLGAGDDTLNLAADTNNTDGVAGAILEFFSAATFNGGTGTNKKFTANSAGLFTVVTPSFQNFS